MSAATPAPALKYIHIESKGAYAIATINREPVNGMDLDLWSELLTTLTTLEADKKCRGVIFQSGLKRDVFTAGNDIKELYSKTTTEQRFHQFWRAQTFFLSRLYRSQLVTIASIRGQCPAGGCVMALACDYRVMNVENDPRIGLNEVALGISVPPYWITLFTQLTGFAVADRLLQTGAQVTSTEAVQLGLINKVVTKDQLLSTAESEMRVRLKFPDSGRIQTKLALRGEVSRKWEAFADQEATEAWKGLSSPGTTAALGAVLARLSAPADKPKSKL